ncbi:MAG: hypothetical protein JSU03_14330 [Bacteroidetes bacterium]|nr:hypothetical protein [Bacteroidota bacterium]MBS1758424.1 hypothetical protein [Bacteroidota bacterium]
MNHTIQKTERIALGLSTLFLMGATQGVYAKPITNNPTEIKFLGSVKKQPVFQLDLNNTESDTYDIVVKNSNGYEIFSEKLNGANLSRKYRLDISEEELSSPDFSLTFEITSLKTNRTKSYKVSQKSQYIQNFEIAAL